MNVKTIPCISNLFVRSRKNETSHPTFSQCFGKLTWELGTCGREICLLIAVSLLLMVFILKIWSLGPYTTRDTIGRLFNLENVMELVVRSFAVACLVWQPDSQPFKYFSAFGIFFAYLGKILTFSDLKTT